MKTFIFIIFIVSHAAATSDDFLAILFEKLHDDISQIQDEAHGDSFTINTDLLNKLNAVYLSVLHHREEVTKQIEHQAQHTMKQLNVNETNASIQRCIKTKNSSIQQMVYETIGGYSVCRTIIENERLKQNQYIDELFGRQHQEHIELEKTRKLCNVPNKTDKDVQICILNNILNVRSPNIRSLKEQTRVILQKFRDVVEGLKQGYTKCMDVVTNDIINQNRDSISFLFEECCRNALKI